MEPEGGNGNGSGNGNGNGKGANGKSAKQGQSDPDGSTDANNTSMEVHHDDGMSEEIQNGRYVMKDSRGRTIINRSATTADHLRLRSFLH